MTDRLRLVDALRGLALAGGGGNASASARSSGCGARSPGCTSSHSARRRVRRRP